MLAAALKKELLLLTRDRGTLASLFLLPVAFIVFFGLVFRSGLDVGPGPVGVAAATPGAALEGVTQALSRTGGEVERLEDEAALRAAVRRGRVAAGLWLPPGFAGPGSPRARLYVDETRAPAARAPVELAARTAVAAVLAGPACAALTAPGTLEVRDVVGREAGLAASDGFQISVPGNVVLFAFFLAVTMGISFIEERRSGTWRRLLAAPVRPHALLVAKLVPFFVIGLLQIGFLLAIGRFAFGMRIEGSLLALLAVSAATVYCAVTLGLLVASFGGSEKAVGGMVSVLLLIMGMLGGTMIPRALLPEAVRTFGRITPQAWALEALERLVLRADTGLTDVGPQLGALFAFGTVFLLVGLARFRFEA